MNIKFFEVRDNATCMPVMCTKLSGQDSWLVHRSGFGVDRDYVFYQPLNGSRTEYDLFNWGDRTRQISHRYIEENWDKLQNEDVVDVRFILKETDAPCKSDYNF